MSPSAHRIEEALALPEGARTELLEALIESLDDGPADEPDEVEAAWADEIAQRLRTVETGSVTPIPWEEARKAIFGSRDDDAPRR